jgi:hypothetical protein
MNRKAALVLAILVAAAFPVIAGEWHANGTNVCTDCHTMHFSMQHDWDSINAPSTTPAANGNWLSSSGPNWYLLKAPANQLCASCHDGQTFAPDVIETNTNTTALTQGRSAGAMNDTNATPYEQWKGHTLGSTLLPPGQNCVAAGVPASSCYTPSAEGLECISCHLQHGSAAIYRNLGPRSAAFQPTYYMGTANNTTFDVWLNVPFSTDANPPGPGVYTPNTGNPAVFNQIFDSAVVSYNVTNPTIPAGAQMQTANRMDTFCSACHGNFHGGPTDANIGGTAIGVGATQFIRHPTSKQIIGKAANGGQSSLTRFVAGTTKVKVYANDRTAWTDAQPGCVSCHKAHGNQNPFGLVFLNLNSVTVGEQGGYSATQIPDVPPAYQTGYRNLCGQCHGQGAS